MKQEVCSAQLYVDETLRIWKNHLEPLGRVKPGMKRISVVTGIHGDELEGQLVAFELARRIQESPEKLTGVVDIYPAINPLGISTIQRSVPQFDLDMNRIFPGNDEGDLVEYISQQVVEDIAGSDLAFDIHASNIFLTEVPQIRINEITAARLVPFAVRANMDFIWVHASATVLQNTLAYSLNDIGTPCLVVEMGVGMRITREYGHQLVDGIFNLMCDLGIWSGEAPANIRKPIVSTDGKVSFVNADAAGVFLPRASHDNFVGAGEELGVIADATTGQVNQVVTSPTDGLLFTLREFPVVQPGSLIARILGVTPEQRENGNLEEVRAKAREFLASRGLQEE
ncbi:MAG: M14 family metallopeptidase [Coriobacteriia bacterium]|nr:M14 family metallopeptidase [Coriobacteriia bacterium]